MAKKTQKKYTKLDAEKELTRLNDIDFMLTTLYLNEQKAIDSAREEFFKKHDILEREKYEFEKKEIEKRLKAWAKKESKNWTGRSFKTSSGETGVRLEKASVQFIKSMKLEAERVVDLVKQILGKKYIRTKEELKKTEILHYQKHLSAKDLQTCGIEIKQKEKTYVKSASADRLEQAVKNLKAN